MALPDPESYQDLNSDKSFTGSSLNEITNYLSQFNKNVESNVKNLNNDESIRYLRTTEYNSLWYVRGAIRTEVSKSIVYIIDIEIAQVGSILKCQCECAGGTCMGSFAHCKHVATALYACACFKQHGSIKTEQTCTQRSQTFQRVKPHKGSPIMKVVNLDMPVCDEVCYLRGLIQGQRNSETIQFTTLGFKMYACHIKA